MGLAVDNTLVYLTGGVALGEVKSYTTGVANAGCLNYGAMNDTKVGWVAGGGVEHKFNRNWAFKGEALYYDLGHQSATGTPCSGCTSEPTLPTKSSWAGLASFTAGGDDRWVNSAIVRARSRFPGPQRFRAGPLPGPSLYWPTRF